MPGAPAGQETNSEMSNHSTSHTETRKSGEHIEQLKAEALRLLAIGYVVHPIAAKGIRYRDRNGIERVTTGKGPLLPGWQKRTLSQGDLLRELHKPEVSGIGFRACEKKAVLDLDGDGWRGVHEYLMGEWPQFEDAPLVRTGSGRVHLHFNCPQMPETFTNEKFSRPDLKAVIELRGNRSNCLLPPSVHPDTNLEYRWEHDPEDFELPAMPFATIHGWLSEWAGVPRTTNAVSGSSGGHAKKVPIGNFALDFVLKGWRLGCPDGISQRHAALRTTRNLLSAGWSTHEVFNAVWAGIEKSPWDRAKGPWKEEEVHAIVEDLARRPAPPLKEREPFSSLGSVQQSSTGLRVVHVHNVVPRVRTVNAKEVASWAR